MIIPEPEAPECNSSIDQSLYKKQGVLIRKSSICPEQATQLFTISVWGRVVYGFMVIVIFPCEYSEETETNNCIVHSDDLW